MPENKAPITLGALAGFFSIPYSMRKAAVYGRERSERKEVKKEAKKEAKLQMVHASTGALQCNLMLMSMNQARANFKDDVESSQDVTQVNSTPEGRLESRMT